MKACIALFLATLQPAVADPNPIHRWTFDNLEDSVGKLTLTLHGGAVLGNGSLRLDGRDSYAVSQPLETSLGARTLVAWVTLATLDQCGGGIASLVNFDGKDVFDGIVYGEFSAGAWDNGSDNSIRSLGKPKAKPEEATTELVIAISYSVDGAIRLYRNGHLLQFTSENGGLVEYPGASRSKPSSQAAFFFGVRHEDRTQSSPSSGGRSAFLNGEIHEVQVFDRELTAAEIAALSAMQK